MIEFEFTVIKDFEKKMNEALRNKIYEKFKAVNSSVKLTLIKIFRDELRSHHTYKALCDPLDLGGDLGVMEHQVTTLTSLVADTISIRTRKPAPSKSVLGGFDIVLLNGGLNQFISANIGKYLTEKGKSIPWLEWLLTRGTDYIVETLDFRIVNFPEGHDRSRTGYKLMYEIKDHFAQFTANFKIDPKYAGREDDNWITQSAHSSIPKILKAIDNELVKRRI